MQKMTQGYWHCGQNRAKMGVSEAPWGVLVFAHKHEPLCGQKTKNKKERLM